MTLQEQMCAVTKTLSFLFILIQRNLFKLIQKMYDMYSPDGIPAHQ